MSVKRNILLNPGPATTTDRVKQALIVPDICPREQEFGDLTKEVREKIVRVVNGTETHTAVMIGGSGTAGVEACLSSVIGKNDKVLVIDNGAYGKRGETIIKAYNIPHETLKLEWDVLPTAECVEAKINETEGLTHLFFIHHETTTGMLNPLDELIALCEKYNLISIVDAMSSYASIPIDLQKTKVDFLVSSSNKGIQGFAGLSFVVSNLKRLEATREIPPNNLYLNLWGNHTCLEKTNQFQFTPPVQVIYALNEALDEFFEETMEGRYKRYCDCYDVMLQGMKDLGFKCLLPEEQHSKMLTTFYDPDVAEYDFDKMHDFLYERDITIYPGKVASLDTFRIANIGDLIPEDMKLYLKELANYLDSINAKLK